MLRRLQLVAVTVSRFGRICVRIWKGNRRRFWRDPLTQIGQNLIGTQRFAESRNGRGRVGAHGNSQGYSESLTSVQKLHPVCLGGDLFCGPKLGGELALFLFELGDGFRQGVSVRRCWISLLVSRYTRQ